ncbi:MBL fold metallo-hydrolase [Mariniblastus sp.]|nr:MBL fold metallo-hydrolase [Mariniblastus sp.]
MSSSTKPLIGGYWLWQTQNARFPTRSNLSGPDCFSRSGVAPFSFPSQFLQLRGYMNLTIHRGTKEIGGSCVEISTSNTRIIIDVGLPLVDQDREPFDRSSMRGKSDEQLIADKIIPNVPGLFASAGTKPDAILLSHAHLDHVGLLKHTPEDIPVYATAGTSKMMLAGAVFAGQDALPRDRHKLIEYQEPFQVGSSYLQTTTIRNSKHKRVWETSQLK